MVLCRAQTTAKAQLFPFCTTFKSTSTKVLFEFTPNCTHRFFPLRSMNYSLWNCKNTPDLTMLMKTQSCPFVSNFNGHFLGPLSHLFNKFHDNRFSGCCVILLTNQPTNPEMDEEENSTSSAGSLEPSFYSGCFCESQKRKKTWSFKFTEQLNNLNIFVWLSTRKQNPFFQWWQWNQQNPSRCRN